MKLLFRTFWGCIFILLSILLLFVFKEYSDKITSNASAYKFLLLGIGLYILLSRVRYRVVRDNLQWLRVFSHEITHVVFSILTFNRIEGFQATKNAGGEVRYHGKGNLLISLTPYSFPLFTIILIFLKQVIALEFTYLFDIVEYDTVFCKLV